MIDELRPMGLADAAKQLGVDPFEVVRLLVHSGAMPSDLHLSQDQVDGLRSFGGIESWHAGMAPEDAAAGLRLALAQLVERGHVGDKHTRADNLWRELPMDMGLAIEEAVAVLTDEGHLVAFEGAAGVSVAIHTEAQGLISSMAEGADLPESVVEALKG